jgi:hypothetical protein
VVVVGVLVVVVGGVVVVVVAGARVVDGASGSDASAPVDPLNCHWKKA